MLAGDVRIYTQSGSFFLQSRLLLLTVCICFWKTKLSYSYVPCKFSRRKKKGDAREMDLGFAPITLDMSQLSTAQRWNADTQFYAICKSHVTWNFAVAVPLSEEIRCWTLFFLCTLGSTQRSQGVAGRYALTIDVRTATPSKAPLLLRYLRFPGLFLRPW